MSLKVGLSRVKIKLNGHVAKLKLATCALIFLAHLKTILGTMILDI